MSILVVHVSWCRCWIWYEKTKKNGHQSEKNNFSKENANFEGVQTHLDRCSPMCCENYSCIFSLKFNGIDEIAGGFTSKLDFRKSSRILMKSRMLQKT